jgi:hypothetical protein
MGKLVECLADIERADQFGYPDTFLYTKLKLRQAKCYKNLCQSERKTPQNMEQLIDASMEINVKVDDMAENSIVSTKMGYNYYNENNTYPNIPSICIKNKEIPRTSDAINIAYNNIFGKHLIATRDIEPG